MEPRTATAEEKAELVAYLLRSRHLAPTAADEAAQVEFVAFAAIAVFDRYITDGPGYAGKLMMVVWSGSPTFAEVFLWEEGRLERCEIES